MNMGHSRLLTVSHSLSHTHTHTHTHTHVQAQRIHTSAAPMSVVVTLQHTATHCNKDFCAHKIAYWWMNCRTNYVNYPNLKNWMREERWDYKNGMDRRITRLTTWGMGEGGLVSQVCGVCVCVRERGNTFVCAHVCVLVATHQLYVFIWGLCLCRCVRMYMLTCRCVWVCIYVYMYIYVYICIYIFINIYIYTYICINI